ncbi:MULTISPECIES: hypothetical protein [unclassified Methanosarcina]|uniref:hypothetical protein n=1 Tax=unclassified Methanosarcina TaxID=2644672 RepID=UPI000AD0097A|nr:MULTISPECIES: hypothetical protein [unclassified Methanosarcina]
MESSYLVDIRRVRLPGAVNDFFDLLYAGGIKRSVARGKKGWEMQFTGIHE